MFPLNTVLFPGVTVPLHVFEDRYRALVAHLLAEPDPAERRFGSVAIREGYEVGSHGSQSLFRVGVRLQLTSATAQPDGTFRIVAVAEERIRMDELDASGPFPQGRVTVLEHPGDSHHADARLVERALAAFAAYRKELRRFRDEDTVDQLPADPYFLSWVLAAAAPLPLPDLQELLETDDTATRLVMITDRLREELRLVSVVPSLPATDVARTRWSPN